MVTAELEAAAAEEPRSRRVGSGLKASGTSSGLLQGPRSSGQRRAAGVTAAVAPKLGAPAAEEARSLRAAARARASGPGSSGTEEGISPEPRPHTLQLNEVYL